jgi:hypothetical protein
MISSDGVQQRDRHAMVMQAGVKARKIHTTQSENTQDKVRADCGIGRRALGNLAYSSW